MMGRGGRLRGRDSIALSSPPRKPDAESYKQWNGEKEWKIEEKKNRKKEKRNWGIFLVSFEWPNKCHTVRAGRKLESRLGGCLSDKKFHLSSCFGSPKDLCKPPFLIRSTSKKPKLINTRPWCRSDCWYQTINVWIVRHNIKLKHSQTTIDSYTPMTPIWSALPRCY